jgi:hypothetical protein
MTDSPSESTRTTHYLHADAVMFEFEEDSTPDSWWIGMQLLYPDDTGEHLAQVGMTDREALDLAEEIIHQVVQGQVKFGVEAAVQERYEEEFEAARHDMPADLFNDLADHLMASSKTEAIFLLERLRNRYGASTRRKFGLETKETT